jgi:hypothetical protein
MTAVPSIGLNRYAVAVPLPPLTKLQPFVIHD